MEAYKRAMKKGNSDPWAVDYNENVAKQAPPENETLLDKAKSFSF
jgi:hypothetical protein